MLVLFTLMASLFRLFSFTTGDGDPNPPEKEQPSSILERYGKDALKLAELVTEARDDRYKASERARKAEEKLKALEGKVLPDGAVVLTGDDASQYQALNLKPAEIAAKLKAAETTAEDLATAHKAEAIRKVADAEGWKPDVLKRYGGTLEYEVREVEVEGVKKQRAFVKDGDAFKPATEHFADLLPALTATGQAQSGGITIPAQQGSTGGVTNLIDAAIKAQQDQRDARGVNPFAPAT